MKGDRGRLPLRHGGPLAYSVRMAGRDRARDRARPSFGRNEALSLGLAVVVLGSTVAAILLGLVLSALGLHALVTFP